MQDVRIKKNELREIVMKNRKEHRAIFLAAQQKYRELAIKVLDDQLKKAREGANINIRESLSLVYPQDHTKDYDRALQMLDLEVGEVITLSQDDFANLVQDEWNWTRSWAISNSAYVSHPKLSQSME